MASPDPPAPERVALDADPAYASLRRLVWSRLGVDLAHYKNKCVERRLGVRLRARHCATLGEYLEHLSKDEAEIQRFLSALTINVTEFFRNPAAFERIREVCFPPMFAPGAPDSAPCETRRRREPVRIWSVGCASGEEPYSLAIILKEWEGDHPQARRQRAEILGTDIDTAMIVLAREGRYDEARLREVSSERRERWFRKEEDGWRMTPEIRAMVRLERADAFRQAPDKPQDLIICRNVLIYFTREQQQILFESFHRVLRPGGYLVLGKAEILIPAARKIFEAICPRERIYAARPIQEAQASRQESPAGGFTSKDERPA